MLMSLFFIAQLSACSESDKAAINTDEVKKKTAVLLVNHGSESAKWREMLLNVEHSVTGKILESKEISEVRTAFMEYTEPSIATQLKAYDEAGYDEVILIPLFLTVSSHSLSDIPNIVGIQSDPKVMDQLAKEKIEVYRPKARVTITPTMDFTTLLKKNVLRRVEALSQDGKSEGVVMVAYGDHEYNQQWEEMMEEIGRYLKVKSGIDTIAYSWCGHLVHYSAEPTVKAIEQVLEMEDSVIVVPLLVAYDPYFQDKIIGKAAEMVKTGDNVKYIPDAILPDQNLNDWVVEITNEVLKRIS